MSAIIKEIYWQEYDTTTQIRTVRADIICDALADLPSGGILDDYKLDIGSRAKVIADGSDWKIQSTGSWVRQPSKLQLDLAGYATEQYVDAGLAAKVDSTTYTAGQASQDAVISAGAMRYEDSGIIRLNQLTWSQTSAGTGMWIADCYTAQSVDKIVSVLITSFGALKPSEIKTLFTYIPSSVSGMHTIRLVCDQNLSGISSNPTLYLRVFGYGYQ